MSQVFIAIARDKKIYFSSPYGEINFRHFLEKYDGRKIEIKLAKNPVSDEMRGFWWGAILPFMRTLDEQWAKLDNDAINEIIKKETGISIFNPITKRDEKIAKSITSDASYTLRAMEAIDWVRVYAMENYARDIPDSEEFLRYRNSAPMK